MTSYKLNHFTIADAQALAGKAADITEWDDDDPEATVTYPGARVIGIIDRTGPYLVIETSGAVVTDAATGERLGTRPPSAELRIGFTRVCEVAGVRDPYRPGDRIALAETGDPHTRLRPGDEGTVTRYQPKPGQLDVRWDSGSTLSMLLNDGDRVRLIAPTPEAGKEAGPASAPSLQPAALEAALRQAADLGRRHGRAAVNRQACDTGTTTREACQDLPDGIASGDPAVTGLYEIPDLTACWDCDRASLAADLQLPDGDPAADQAADANVGAARQEFWLEAARLARRLATGTGDETEDEDGPEPWDGEPAPGWQRQDISDPATGLSRLLSERCQTCILRSGDPMHLGPERTAGFIRQALDAGSYVVCHGTLTYGDFPGYGPAICRGFFDAYRTSSAALLILQAGRRLTEVPPPGKAEEPGRDAG